MRFQQIFSKGRPVLSFEFFPPREESLISATENQIRELVALQPDFTTVTYGAGGGKRLFSLDLVRFIREETTVPVCPHLTCVGHTKEELLQLAKEFEAAGVEQILALRGDPPAGKKRFETHPNGFSCARDFVRYLRAETSLEIAVAGYPEIHHEASSKSAALQYLKEKVDAGAELIITQLFFDEQLYFEFVEDAASFGINVPILPGIMPIATTQQLERLKKLSGAEVPQRIIARLEKIGENSAEIAKYGVEEAIRLSEALLQRGAPGLHFYTLNKSTQVGQVVQSLNGRMKRPPLALLETPIVR